MPVLQVFVACEKVVVDEQTKQITLISLLDAFSVPSDDKVPENAVAPLSWCVLTLFRRTPDDPPDAEFEQRIGLMTPAGTVAEEKTLPAAKFRFSKSGHRQTYHMNGLPVGQAGDYKVQASLRRVGETEWKVLGEYSIRIVHQTPEAQAES